MTFLNIRVDAAALDDLKKLHGLTEKQFKHSLKRAMTRTAGTARSAISKSKLGIADLRRTTAIRKRVKPLLKSRNTGGSGVWIGLNDLWASEFRGRPKRTPGGIDFRGQHFDGAFLVRFTGSRRNRIFRNVNGRLQEVTIPIAQQALNYLEKHVLPDLPEAMLNHFRTDVEFRSQLGAYLTGKEARRKFYRVK